MFLSTTTGSVQYKIVVRFNCDSMALIALLKEA